MLRSNVSPKRSTLPAPGEFHVPCGIDCALLRGAANPGQCRLVKPKRWNAAGLVGRTPWSARDALVPLFARRIGRLRPCGRPTRASTADQGVRPTIHTGDAMVA